MSKSEPTVLDSKASITMFRHSGEALEGSYRVESNDTVELAAGSATMKCLGSGTILLASVQLDKSFHVENLNGSPVSVGKVCERTKTVLFTSTQAVILDINEFTVFDEDINAAIPRNTATGLYESETIISQSHTQQTSQKKQRYQYLASAPGTC